MYPLFPLVGCFFKAVIRIGYLSPNKGPASLPANISNITSISRQVSVALWGAGGGHIWCVSLFIVDAVIMTAGPVLVDFEAVSSGSYPAVPGSVQPGSGILHQGLLQPHLWIINRIICSQSFTDNKGPEILHQSYFFYICACTRSAFSLHNQQSCVGGKQVSFAKCHSALCHSLQCETTFIPTRLQEHPTVDEPVTSWTVRVVQDILVPHLLPRNALSSCACVFICVSLRGHPWQNYIMQVRPQTLEHLQESCVLR